MGTIRVQPEQVAAAGDQISALAPAAGELAGVAQSAGAGVSEPPATAEALAECATAWGTAAGRLQDELLAIGGSAQAAAFLYLDVDANAMGGGE